MRHFDSPEPGKVEKPVHRRELSKALGAEAWDAGTGTSTISVRRTVEPEPARSASPTLTVGALSCQLIYCTRK